MEKVGFRVPVLSIARGTQSVKGIIRENKIPQIESIIQMGKSEGMFTMDRYLKEYLLTRPSFVPPSENFRPSPELAQDLVYQSPLVDGDGLPQRTPDAAYHGTDAGAGMQRQAQPGAAFHPGNGNGADKFYRGQPDNGNGLAKTDQPYAEGGRDFGQAADGVESSGPQLIIDEKATVDELIAQISNFGRQKT
jgi:hypothetical protein